MRIFIYKQTHDGDPDENGVFGAQDCMGRVRGWSFDAVIGIGGIGQEAQSYGFAGNVNWIGIGPRKTVRRGYRGPTVTFEHFVDFESDGPKLKKLAPKLGGQIYSSRMRYLMVDSETVDHSEINNVLRLARNAPPSPGLVDKSVKTTAKCRQVPKPRKTRCKRPACS